jgi:ATP-dependent DNA helicase PIF1
LRLRPFGGLGGSVPTKQPLRPVRLVKCPTVRSPNAFLRSRRAVWPGWRRPLTQLPIVVVDLETTGLEPSRDRIVELSLSVPGGPRIDSLVAPQIPLGPQRVHGLTEADLHAAPAFRDLAGAVLSLAATRLIVAHNAEFDVAFLRAELLRAGHPVPPAPFLCTIALPQLLGLDHASRRLAWACEHYSVPLTRPHEAAADADAAAALFQRYSRLAASTGLTLADLSQRAPHSACVRSWRRRAWKAPTPLPAVAAPSPRPPTRAAAA